MASDMSLGLDGICDSCGYMGMVETPCPECGKLLISLVDEKPLASSDSVDADDDGRYSPDQLQTVSIDELAEEEAMADDNHEDL